MAKQPWMKFYPSDWRSDPALRMCSVAARGLWIEMLCIMHEAEPRGFLTINGIALNPKQLASLTGIPVREIVGLLGELEDAAVFSRADNGTIYSRRILRDMAKEARDKERGGQGGNPEIRRGTVPKEQRVRPFKRSDSPAKTQRIFDRDGGRCHWCKVELERHEYAGARTFHIDHVVAVCDGGTNDESNLVAACAACNHKRARLPRIDVGSDTDTNPDNNHDTKAHWNMASGYGSTNPIQGSEDYQEEALGRGRVVALRGSAA